jgi:hypothetical protein
MIAGPLPLDGTAKIILRPHLGQFEYSLATECPRYRAAVTSKRETDGRRYWPNVQYSVNPTYRSYPMCKHRPRIA